MIDFTPEMILIPISQEQFAIVDRDDADLAKLKWSAQSRLNGGKPKFHAARAETKGATLGSPLMHRVIMSRILNRKLTTLEIVDHINGNALDNRRNNLRIATSAENNFNRSKRYNTSSPYKGVYQPKGTSKWSAQVSKNGIRYHCSGFNTAAEAFEGYCLLGRAVHGEFFNSGEEAA